MHGSIFQEINGVIIASIGQKSKTKTEKQTIKSFKTLEQSLIKLNDFEAFLSAINTVINAMIGLNFQKKKKKN